MGKKSTFTKDVGNEDNITVLSSPVVIIQSTQSGPFHISRIIQEMRPSYVIMYDSDMTVVRQLEVFQAKNPQMHLKVFFMMYDKSVEEQSYLTTLRKEKEAFEHLMEEKKHVGISEEREGKVGDNQDLSRDPTKASDAIMEKDNSATRKGGAQVSEKQSKIIVDMREFRCELPSLIHKRGIDIEPLTIDVGDYILTPDICIERKSISDLIGSLQSGRLYNQVIKVYFI